MNTIDPSHTQNWQQGQRLLKVTACFLLRLSDDEITEVDPVTKKRTFLKATTAGVSDMATVYILLLKNPSLLERYRKQVVEEMIEEQKEEARTRARKWKRERVL